MSSSRTLPAAALAALLPLAGLLALAGCTSGPLYGTTGVDPASGARASVLGDLRGRIGVEPAQTRTAQIFRDAMLFQLNGAQAVRDPLYTLRYTVTATDQVSALESGTGVPTASLYRLSVGYELVRASDSGSVARGTRMAMIPYDRTGQVFASTRAVVDAQAQAGETVAQRILLAIAPAIRRDATAGASVAAATAKP